LEEFENAIADDLDTPKAIAVMWKLLRDENANGKIKTIEKMDQIFGLDLLEKREIKIPRNVQELLKQRQQAREKKDFKKADELRDEIEKLGFGVKDNKIC